MESDEAPAIVMSRAYASTPASDRVNVLFVVIQMAMGGTERLVLNILQRLDRSTFAPSVAWLVEGKPTREFAELAVPLFCAPKRKPFDWSAMRQVARIVRENRIDVVNAHHFLSAVYAFHGAKIANRAGLVYTEHSEADVKSATGKWRIVGRRLLRSCEAVVGVSDRVTQTLQSHFKLDRSRLHTVRNGVDVDRIADATTRRDAMRRSLGIGDGEIVVGHVANFRRNKNHLFLLRAFREVAARDSRARLLLVGQGFAGDPENSEAAARRFVAEHGMGDVVRFLGYRADVEEMVAAFDIGCLVSYNEGLPLSVMEYMAAGVPVIATNIDAISIAVSSGQSGLLVAPDDVQGLSHALMSLAGDAAMRARMGDSAREIARSRYSLARCVDETARLLLSAARRGRRSPMAAGAGDTLALNQTLR